MVNQQAEESPMAKVMIEDYSFNPNQLTIKPGTKVVWTNHDPVDHTVVSSEKDLFTSPLLASGESFEHTFEKPGQYEYICSLHPAMRGTIIVEE